MIVQSTRISVAGGVRYLENHLLDKLDENEKIEILAGDRSALNDAHALAVAKGCKYSVRHFSLSPELDMRPDQLRDFLRSLNAEFAIGTNRPYLLVRHTKKSRAHFHLAIAEVDPVEMKVLSCRKDYSRLEKLARAYETSHGETIQLSRTERRSQRIEGFSDIARKRAERLAPGFDRTTLRKAFESGTRALQAELKRQGLLLKPGRKLPILVNMDGKLVAAAHRACGVRKRDFLERISQNRPERVESARSTAPVRRWGVSRVHRNRRLEEEMWAMTHLEKFDPEELLRRAQEVAQSLFGVGHIRPALSRGSPADPALPKLKPKGVRI